MPLKHVYMWEAEIGYRFVTAEEAQTMYPNGVAAKSGFFICWLCQQEVTFTRKGKMISHFRHKSSAQDKECEDREKRQSTGENGSLAKSDPRPVRLRLCLCGEKLSFELGLYCPSEQVDLPGKFEISGGKHSWEYSSQRLQCGITYFSVGGTLCKEYQINVPTPFSKYWPKTVKGVDPKGTLFVKNADGTATRILPGGKAPWERSYYLLQKEKIYSSPTSVLEIRERLSFLGWYLYEISVNCFSKQAARFFLKWQIQLTNRPVSFYPVWPVYKETPGFRCYHALGGSFSKIKQYVYMEERNGNLWAYPKIELTGDPMNRGNLYCFQAKERSQLVSLGAGGVLGVSYMRADDLREIVATPQVKVESADGILAEDIFTKPPKGKRIFVTVPFDGRVLYFRGGSYRGAIPLIAGVRAEIPEISLGMEIRIFQGQDLVRTLRVERPAIASDEEDAILLKQLRACRGSERMAPHSLGALANVLKACPKTRQWLLSVIRMGRISERAYRILVESVERMRGKR